MASSGTRWWSLDRPTQATPTGRLWPSLTPRAPHRPARVRQTNHHGEGLRLDIWTRAGLSGLSPLPHKGNDDGLTCDAFPRGIPDTVILGGDPHTGPLPGDHGIRFEPLPQATVRG
jgi:hypothetical protein